MQKKKDQPKELILATAEDEILQYQFDKQQQKIQYEDKNRRMKKARKAFNIKFNFNALSPTISNYLNNPSLNLPLHKAKL